MTPDMLDRAAPQVPAPGAPPLILPFEEIRRTDVSRVGGKNASLGEMTANLATHGIKVPPGYATTTECYWRFVQANGLTSIIASALEDLKAGVIALPEAGLRIRRAFVNAEWPSDIAEALTRAYKALNAADAGRSTSVAVRSSATAEDLPGASFAGQLETFLNVTGEQALLDACRRCFASLFTDRAISYRDAQGYDHLKVAVSVGVQRMVRSDLGSAGVMFSIDTETGFDRVVLINAAWGLGENVVQGTADPDEYVVYKPFLNDSGLRPILEKSCGGKAVKMIYGAPGGPRTLNIATSPSERSAFALSDSEILTLARWGAQIEAHYGCPMDMEWAKDGETAEIFIVQARPETVQSRRVATAFRSYRIGKKGKLLASGLSIGAAIVTGRVCVLKTPAESDRFVDGAVLVAETTDPDWVPVMRRASAVITDHGGRTSHAAIVSRELGLPSIVGAVNATRVLHDGQEITVSCAEGDAGFIYEGNAEFTVTELDLSEIIATKTGVMLNLANPAAAFRWWQLPADGIGLARMEFVISNHIKIHPMALVHFDRVADAEARRQIEQMTQGYASKADYFVERLSEGLSRIAAAFHPKPVIIRMSDFKTNEYAGLIGGRPFEPEEENPMIGIRGASRYYLPIYREGFALECQAIRRLREEMGFKNVVVMIPFCRTPKEADQVLAVMAENGLVRGQAGLSVYVMCEIPSNVILAKAFAERFDGFSIGSNDLTQLTLGVDRDSAALAPLFDEQDEAVEWMIRHVIAEAHKYGAKVGLCGQAPSNHPEFAEFLVECSIDSVSVTPDSFLAVKRHIAQAETRLARRAVS
jgi:pyruvate,water dikinase